ncbi:MAG: thiolase family protein [Hyphomicrobiales bacterium]|nr:thiolase family protein [Hyphomicrobiales bacterium]
MQAYVSKFADAYLLAGMRTPFVDYMGAFALISPTDLAIKAARAVFATSGVDPAEVGMVVTGNMAQASFDAYMLPRHTTLYSGVPQHVPAHMVQRVCGTGVEALMQGSDAVSLGRVNVALVAGAESMSRNPVASYTTRTGFRMGDPGFKDFLWEALLDPSCGCTMGHTAENLAKRYNLSRGDVDAFAAQSFARAVAAQKEGFFAGEIAPVSNEKFTLDGHADRGIKLRGKDETVAADTHIRPSPLEALAKIRPAFGGVQTGGNSSAVVDGAAAALVVNGATAKKHGGPLARIIAGCSVGVEPAYMGIGPAPAIRALLAATGLQLSDIDFVEINEAFGAQCLACARELGLDEARLNPNGGAIAIGHPLGATGVRLTMTLARQLQRTGKRYGISSACIGGGQGIALLIENVNR